MYWAVLSHVRKRAEVNSQRYASTSLARASRGALLVRGRFFLHPPFHYRVYKGGMLPSAPSTDSYWVEIATCVGASSPRSLNGLPPIHPSTAALVSDGSPLFAELLRSPHRYWQSVRLLWLFSIAGEAWLVDPSSSSRITALRGWRRRRHLPPSRSIKRDPM